MNRGLLLVAALVVAGCSPAASQATTASPTPSSRSSPLPSTSPAPVALADWPQYHRNAARTGQGPAKPTLDQPARAWSAALDGSVYASPLIVGGRVIAATENNTVYSLDLKTGAVIWKKHLGPPVDAGTLPCGNIGPVTGITGTPAADPLSGQLYVVTFLSGYRHVLFTLNLSDGSVVGQQDVDPPGSSPRVQQQRAALSLTPAYVYVLYGGLAGDCGAYHGYVVGVPRQGGRMAVYRTPSTRESGFWTPMGATVSDSGTVYVVTGNGSSSSSFDYSNSVLQLSPDLKLEGYFAPANWPALDAGDVDLGSVGVALLPSLGALVSIGKEGVVYVLRTSGLGGVGGQAAAARACAGAWGGSAWTWTRVFLPCADGLIALDISRSGMSPAWRAAGVRTASPIVAAGAVWAIDVTTSTLFALDIDSGAVLFSTGLGNAQHFSTPAATQGYVLVPAGSAITAIQVAP